MDTWRVTLTAEELELTQLVAKEIGRLNALAQISLAQAMMSSPQALISQMKNMASRGTLSAVVAGQAERVAERIERTSKTQRLLSLLEQLRRHRPNHWRVVVFTSRTETLEAIGRDLASAKMRFAFVRGNAGALNQRALGQFREDPPRVNVLVSTDTGAEGINLQVANVLVNYDLPWNPMVLEQRIGRIQRLGSPHKYVVICNLVAADSVEERIVARLMEKLQLIAHAIGDIDAVLEAAGCDGDESDSTSFVGRIRDLVVKSLIGQDTTWATELMKQSIERAKAHLETNRQELDNLLGELDALHRTGPSMPKLKRIEPSIAFKEFVLRAKRLDGGEVKKVDASRELFEVYKSGHLRERLTFNEETAADGDPRNVFGGNIPRLYLPGKTAFERLGQHLVDHHSQFLVDASSLNDRRAAQIAHQWSAKIAGAKEVKARFVPKTKGFQGSVLIRARATNGVDSYEKVVKGNIPRSEHDRVPREGEPVRAEVAPSEVYSHLKYAVARVVEADSDISEFCRFYDQRRSDELRSAGGDQWKIEKINADFAPRVEAEISGCEGVVYDIGDLEISFTLDGAQYTAQIEVIPASGQILRDVDWECCQVTGCSVPSSCLDGCVVSNRRVLRHLLGCSEESGQLALREYLVTCPQTGKTVLQTELGTSSLTGKTGARSLFLTSPVSGRTGLPEDFARCEITGAEVLKDELVESQVSHRKFRSDEQAVSAVSGTRGHRTEFVRCSVTGNPILPEEASRSSVTGQTVEKTLLTTCAETGVPLLPEETAVCELTSRRVDARLLARSVVSGKTVLRRLLVPCAETQQLALPEELEECQITNNRVLPGLLAVCEVSHLRCLKQRMVESAESGRLVRRELAVFSLASGRPALPEETAECTWLEGPILKSESGWCQLTHVRMAAKFLNARGEFDLLRTLLDGRCTTAVLPSENLLLWLREQRPFKSFAKARGVLSPSGGVIALCGEVGFLWGVRVRHVGLLISVKGEYQILGSPAVGKRSAYCWIPTD